MIKTWRGYIGIYRLLVTLIKPTAAAGKKLHSIVEIGAAGSIK